MVYSCALANRFLRLHGRLVDLRHDFIIIDPDDQLAIVKKIIKEEVKEANFYTDKPKAIVNFINKCKDEGRRASDLLVNAQNRLQQLIYSQYEKYTQRENKLDFGELILLTKGDWISHDHRLIDVSFDLELLEKELDLRRHYAQKFQFLLIDEFQDTSTLQMDWLKLMMDRDDTTRCVHNCFMAVVRTSALFSSLDPSRPLG